MNDFRRNISSSKSYCLNDRDKVKVLNLLKKTGFNRSGIKNTSLRVAFGVKDVSRSAFETQIKRMTPLKEKRCVELMYGKGPSVGSRNMD